jgi:hypothetical protein
MHLYSTCLQAELDYNRRAIKEEAGKEMHRRKKNYLVDGGKRESCQNRIDRFCAREIKTLRNVVAKKRLQ